MSVSTLVATAGAANANAYCSVAFADQYQADRPAVGTTWATATADAKTAAILWATQLLDSLYEWTGYTSTSDQALLWPRNGMWKKNGLEYVAIDEIPIELQRACAEYARQLLVSDLAGNSDIETLGLKALTAGSVSFQFKDSVYAKPVPDTVFNLLPASWGVVRGRVTGVRHLLRA